jgi:ribosome maturation factor RimP
MTPGPKGRVKSMRPDLCTLEDEITPLLSAHGVELVALQWLQGPGHGILRVTIDNPGGDPRQQEPEMSVSLAQITQVSRDVSTALDALDLVEGPYTLEVGSPGTERPVQRRADFERFLGLSARIEARTLGHKTAVTGVIRGTVDHSEGFAVRLEVAGQVRNVVFGRDARARLLEMNPPNVARPGKVPTRRQQRLAERERARAINAAHLADKRARAAAEAVTAGDSPGSQTYAPGAGHATGHSRTG